MLEPEVGRGAEALGGGASGGEGKEGRHGERFDSAKGGLAALSAAEPSSPLPSALTSPLACAHPLTPSRLLCSPPRLHPHPLPVEGHREACTAAPPPPAARPRSRSPGSARAPPQRLRRRLLPRPRHLELQHHARLARLPAAGSSRRAAPRPTRGSSAPGTRAPAPRAGRRTKPVVDPLGVERAGIVVREQVGDEGLELLLEAPRRRRRAARAVSRSTPPPWPREPRLHPVAGTSWRTPPAPRGWGSRAGRGGSLRRVPGRLLGLEVAREHEQAPQRVLARREISLEDHVLVEHAARCCRPRAAPRTPAGAGGRGARAARGPDRSSWSRASRARASRRRAARKLGPTRGYR